MMITKRWQGPNLREKLSSDSSVSSVASLSSQGCSYQCEPAYWIRELVGGRVQRKGREKEREWEMRGMTWAKKGVCKMNWVWSTVELSPGTCPCNSRGSEDPSGTIGIFTPYTCACLLWEQMLSSKSFLHFIPSYGRAANLKNLPNNLEKSWSGLM